MIGSFIIFLIALILRITLGTLTGKFVFLKSWLPYFNIVVIACAVVFAVFVIIAIVKQLGKGNGKN